MGSLIDRTKAGFIVLLFAVSTSAYMVLSKAALSYLPAPACLHLLHMLTTLGAVWLVSSQDVLDVAVEPLSAAARAQCNHHPGNPVGDCPLALFLRDQKSVEQLRDSDFSDSQI